MSSDIRGDSKVPKHNIIFTLVVILSVYTLLMVNQNKKTMIMMMVMMIIIDDINSNEILGTGTKLQAQNETGYMLN